jgi:3-dehydroquinate dehydratase / shikimate dehydrogenase
LCAASSSKSTGRQVELVATLTAGPELEAAPRALLERVAILEVRADRAGDLDPDWLRQRFPGKLLYTLRSRGEGGLFRGDAAERRRRFQAAAAAYDLVDLEADRDLGDATLALVPPAKRLLSWHGGPATHRQLEERLAALDEVEAPYRKLVSGAQRHGQELPPLLLLAEAERGDITAFSLGEVGGWTRLFANILGAPLLYGSLAETPAAAGQPSILRLTTDFGLPDLPPIEAVFGIAGRPVSHSLSPRIHNAAYRALGLPYLYLPFHVEQFGDFWLETVESDLWADTGIELRGLSVTAPWKDAALAVAGASSPRAQAIGGANTLRLRRGVWEGESTDPEGVRLPLEWRGVDLARPTRVAVVGAGGAGAAAAFGLSRAGAAVTLFNRGEERGRSVAERLHVPFEPLERLDPAAFQVLVHATPLGREPEESPPFDAALTRPDAIVVEMVYAGFETSLERRVREAGRALVTGREVLLAQAITQFRLLTDAEIPIEQSARLLDLDLPAAMLAAIGAATPEAGAPVSTGGAS